jgi:hypothetical protein
MVEMVQGKVKTGGELRRRDQGGELRGRFSKASDQEWLFLEIWAEGVV